MKKSVVVPLVMLASISLLTACTEPTAPAVVPPAPPVSSEPAAVVTPPPAAAQSVTKIVTYPSPAGVDEVEFSVTVEGGVIKSASSRTLATNDGSKYNQDNFASAVSAKVVGKSVKDLDLDVIGGASLTTEAFEKFVKSL